MVRTYVLRTPWPYAKILFIDFSSAFNTNIPGILTAKLSQLMVPSHTRTVSICIPQRSVIFPLHFSFYTNNCVSSNPLDKLLKYSDDTTVIDLICDGGMPARSWPATVHWCSHNNLELNTLKAFEIIVDFMKHSLLLQSSSRIWSQGIPSSRKDKQMMFFLKKLRKLGRPQEMLRQFYTAAIKSVLCSSITVWYGATTAKHKNRLQQLVKWVEKIIGAFLFSLLNLKLMSNQTAELMSRTKKRAEKMITDFFHPGHNLIQTLPSGRRYRTIKI